MKKFVIGLLMLAVMIAVSVLSALAVYDYKLSKFNTELETDTQETVVDNFELYSNPVFDFPSDAMEYQLKMKERQVYDSIFMSIKPEILEDISKVLDRKYGTITLHGIVDEFVSNDTYLFLHGQQNVPPESEIQKAEEPHTVDTIHTKSDTIASINMVKESSTKVSN